MLQRRISRRCRHVSERAQDLDEKWSCHVWPPLEADRPFLETQRCYQQAGQYRVAGFSELLRYGQARMIILLAMMVVVVVVVAAVMVVMKKDKKLIMLMMLVLIMM